MVDRAGHLEDDPGVAPLLPPRARLARSPTVALVAAATLSGAVMWRRSRTSSSPSSRSTRRVYAGSTVWDGNACRGPASTDVPLHEQESCSSHATTSEPARLRFRGETSSRHRPRRTATSGHASARSSTRPRRANPPRSPTASTTVGPSRASPRSINLMGASSGRGISTPTPAPPPRLSAPPHHSPVARPRHPSTRNANSRARHRERRPDRARTRPLPRRSEAPGRAVPRR